MSREDKTIGRGLGRGHGSNTPNLPIIREKQMPPLPGLQPGSKYYKMGRCKIILSPPFRGHGWHMSISRDDHYPSWDEVAHAWYSLVSDADERTGLMILPPHDQYIDIHNFCFQVHEEPKR